MGPFAVLSLLVVSSFASLPTVSNGPLYPFGITSLQPGELYTISLVTDIYGAHQIQKHPIYNTTLTCTPLDQQCVVFLVNSTTNEGKEQGRPVLTPFYACSGLIPEVDKASFLVLSFNPDFGSI